MPNSSDMTIKVLRPPYPMTIYVYQTDLVDNSKLPMEERQQLAKEAKWISLRKQGGAMNLAECKCPLEWYAFGIIRYTMSLSEYNRIKTQLLKAESYDLPKHPAPEKKAWVSLREGSRRRGGDWQLVCDLSGVSWGHSTEEHVARVRKLLIELAGKDEGKAKPYGSRPDEVLFSLAWLKEISKTEVREQIRTAYDTDSP